MKSAEIIDIIENSVVHSAKRPGCPQSSCSVASPLNAITILYGQPFSN
jgi:hypothetical protein